MPVTITCPGSGARNQRVDRVRILCPACARWLAANGGGPIMRKDRATWVVPTHGVRGARMV